MTIPKEYLDMEMDFGFTTEDTEERISASVSNTAQTLHANYQEKLKQVEKLIIPLLVNLMKNPEVDTIKWPNRAPVIEKQIEKILAITRS